MANFLKLFLDRRLTASEPEHLTFIKGRLAAMKAEGDATYKHWSDFYGVDVDVQVTKEPEIVVSEEVVIPKKRGRKPKTI
jgi:hypothetical protein